MKKMIWMMAAAVMLAGCSKDDDNEVTNPVDGVDGKTLVVFFNGPMPDGVDATTGATPVVNGMSATQYVAQQIVELTGADVHHITVADNHYPKVYEELATFARSEKESGTHPALTSRLANLDKYKNVIIGTPVWWYTLPMPIHSFLDSYNLSGKNVMVFTTHEGSGLADAIERIKEQEPNAIVSSNGFHSRGNNVASQGDAIKNWITRLGFTIKKKVSWTFKELYSSTSSLIRAWQVCCACRRVST